MTEVCVLGSGSWGTAIALALGRKGILVRLWGRDAEVLDSINSGRENVRYLPGFELGPTVRPVSNLPAALVGADMVVVAVPSGAVRELLTHVAALNAAEIRSSVWVLAAKGLEASTGLRMTEVVSQVMEDAMVRLVALSGPNLAIELARGVPTATVAASYNLEAAKAVQAMFVSERLRVYTNSDVVGVELGGALKNVLAIAAGISDALGFGDNTKGALLARGLIELTRLGAAMGARGETFLGLAGVGDLFATASSTLSRNYRVGFELGRSHILPDILARLGQVAEGVPTAHAAVLLARRHSVELPIFEILEQVLSGRVTAGDAVTALMLRAPKVEI